METKQEDRQANGTQKTRVRAYFRLDDTGGYRPRRNHLKWCKRYETVRQLVRKMGLEFYLDQVHYDVESYNTSMRTWRKHLDELLYQAAGGEFDVLVVSHLKDFGLDTASMRYALKMLGKGGVEVCSPAGGMEDLRRLVTTLSEVLGEPEEEWDEEEEEEEEV